MNTLKARLDADVKDALRRGEKERLGVLRMILAAVKQREVDGRRALDDADIIAVLERLARQHRESIEQFRKGKREDLADKEARELAVVTAYLPAPLDEAGIQAAVDAAIAETGAASLRDMGKVMGLLKSRLQGRADMGAVSARVKQRLG